MQTLGRGRRYAKLVTKTYSEIRKKSDKNMIVKNDLKVAAELNAKLAPFYDLM